VLAHGHGFEMAPALIATINKKILFTHSNSTMTTIQQQTPAFALQQSRKKVDIVDFMGSILFRLQIPTSVTT